MDRRAFLAGAAGLALATPAIGAERASRSFRILRGGDEVGMHTLDAVLGPNGFEIAIDASIVVRVLGIAAYRYELQNREVWRGGRIVSVDSRVNDDGTDERAVVQAAGDQLSIDGSGYTGPAPLEAATTSYYAPGFLQRRPWISTQSGKLLSISISETGEPGWHKITGDLQSELGYVDGEWVKCRFDAGGEPGIYEVVRQSGKIADLWAKA